MILTLEWIYTPLMVGGISASSWGIHLPENNTEAYVYYYVDSETPSLPHFTELDLAVPFVSTIVFGLPCIKSPNYFYVTSTAIILV